MNKLKYAIYLLLLLCTMSSNAQNKTYTTTVDEKNGSVVFVGKCDFADLYTEPSFDWMRTGTAGYMPDGKALKILQTHLHEYELLVFLGTWCGDSKDLVPPLYKILDLVHYPSAMVSMYSMARGMKTGLGIEQKYHITNAPTFILVKNGKEAGRITESVEESVEKDLAAIIMRRKK